MGSRGCCEHSQRPGGGDETRQQGPEAGRVVSVEPATSLNWTELLARAGIPESPGYQELLALIREERLQQTVDTVQQGKKRRRRKKK